MTKQILRAVTSEMQELGAVASEGDPPNIGELELRASMEGISKLLITMYSGGVVRSLTYSFVPFVIYGVTPQPHHSDSGSFGYPSDIAERNISTRPFLFSGFTRVNEED